MYWPCTVSLRSLDTARQQVAQRGPGFVRARVVLLQSLQAAFVLVGTWLLLVRLYEVPDKDINVTLVIVGVPLKLLFRIDPELQTDVRSIRATSFITTHRKSCLIRPFEPTLAIGQNLGRILSFVGGNPNSQTIRDLHRSRSHVASARCRPRSTVHGAW